MKRLLLIALLALASNACATAKPEYHAVSEGVLIPPVSTFEPAVSTATTPRPPVNAPAPPPASTKPEATPRPPVAVSKTVAKSDPSTEVLKSQINNLLAQVDSLQKHNDNNRRPSKLERYARELAAKDAELKAVQNELIQQVATLEQYRRELATMNAELKNAQVLRNKALDDVISLREKMAIDKKKLERFQTHLQVSIFLLLVLTVFAFYFGRVRGGLKAARDVQVHIAELKSAAATKDRRIAELYRNHEADIRLRGALLTNLHHDVAEKNRRIGELEEKLKEERKMYRNRIQELKRQRAGPLPETADDDPPPETPPDEDNSPETVFGPLEREEREE